MWTTNICSIDTDTGTQGNRDTETGIYILYNYELFIYCKFVQIIFFYCNVFVSRKIYSFFFITNFWITNPCSIDTDTGTRDMGKRDTAGTQGHRSINYIIMNYIN